MTELAVKYCQPTSSKVKVEDMVTDPPTPKYPQYNNPQCESPSAWTYDLCMPTEWNCMIADMQNMGGAKEIIKSALYGSPQLHEISDQIKYTPPPEDTRIYHLNPSSDPEYEWSICNLRKRYAPSSIKPPPKVDKGKRREDAYTEEDIPSL
ncbi:hypothetical protein BDQ17DRAFT_1327392 [Cyathus striatus]|nr:hypothetical protein BDQ17DRAFT_1327392 [Cyathus striatus]